MPYASQRQRRFFHTETARRKGISAATVHEFDEASKGMRLPETARSAAEKIHAIRKRGSSDAREDAREMSRSKRRFRVRKSKAHPGFKAVASGIAARQGIPVARADAILASRTRGASPAAKAANPRLRRVPA